MRQSNQDSQWYFSKGNEFGKQGINDHTITLKIYPQYAIAYKNSGNAYLN
ncbi:unnamed protein product [Paramecium sonneborni]|uniref:Uncharacterized protein n=1 Tax=Paramecium sonneborni TaxID=65129 RepID=A0A8S1RKF5_9CILI|nr:unnamed protein product [Paramecium sonneborni]